MDTRRGVCNKRVHWHRQSSLSRNTLPDGLSGAGGGIEHPSPGGKGLRRVWGTPTPKIWLIPAGFLGTLGMVLWCGVNPVSLPSPMTHKKQIPGLLCDISS